MLGIGSSVAIFSIVNGVLLQPLPYPEPNRLVQIWDTNRTLGIAQVGVSHGNLKEWRLRARIFEGIAGYYTMGRTLTTGDDSRVVLTSQVTSDFFSLLGKKALIGRTFTAEECKRAFFNSAAAPKGPDPVAVISYRVWTSIFGSDPNVFGRTIALERRPWHIVGVMPKDFTFPSKDVDLWIPWNLEGDLPRDQHYLSAIARIKSGITLKQAEQELNRIA